MQLGSVDSPSFVRASSWVVNAELAKPPSRLDNVQRTMASGPDNSTYIGVPLAVIEVASIITMSSQRSPLL
jgi:hypothetical protein